MAHDNLIQKLHSGEIKLHEIEKHLSAGEALNLRNEFVAKTSGIDISNLAATTLDAEKLQNKNIENLIGSIEIPLGIAGPLNLNNPGGSYYIPMATTEGALVASVSRGCKIINASGGANVLSIYKGTTRAPVFELPNLHAAQQFCEWIDTNQASIAQKCESTSGHLKFIGLSTYVLGRSVWVRFVFDTDQAMGMNMATIASSAACEFICENFTDAKLIALSGNMCIDKKSSTINTILGRGREVHAEIEIPEQTLIDVLKCDIESFLKVTRIKTWEGSMLAGSNNANAHVANIVAAMFLATGQDAAQVIESSSSFFSASRKDDKLYAAIKLPSLMIASVGGGTSLNKQNTTLNLATKNIAGEQGNDRAEILAKLIASAALAGELSLHGALAANHLTKAHLHLGRNKKS